MKNIIDRDDKGIALCDTIKRRIIFLLMVIFVISISIFSIITLLFIPYWIFTGRNILKDIFDI
jgi:hypothetical protein